MNHIIGGALDRRRDPADLTHVGRLTPVVGERARDEAAMWRDPVTTNPDHYTVIMENDQVRVLEYTDAPGDVTTPHDHPDSVMYTLSSFRRRLHADDTSRDVEIASGGAHWLPAQRHYGQNTGDTDTHVIFVELKSSTGAGPATALGPA
jgi:quercetin dioxygenase-like cupin family protein